MIWLILTLLCSPMVSYKYLPYETKSNLMVSSNVQHKYIATINDVPYHVLIVYNNLYCSGSLLRSDTVVTAASCITAGNFQRGVVKIGSNTLTGPGQIIPILEIKVHEYFQHISSMNNDIALLVLKENVMLAEKITKPILIDSDITLTKGTAVYVSGWGGANLQAKYVNMLLWSEMVVISRNECLKYYRHLVTSSNFCVKYQPEHRLSDNGGPAIYKDFLVGLVSFGATEFNETNIAVLTNISYFHRWIILNTSRLMKKYCKPIYDS